MRWLAILSALSLGACSGTVQVPPVRIDVPGHSQPVSGRYAVLVQSGGWSLETKPQGFVCSVWSFKTDANQAYETAMRDVLTRALEKVDFVPGAVSLQDLRARGYDAFIAIHQGNASSMFGIQQNFFSGTARSQVELSAILAISDDHGPYYQQTVTGKGLGMLDVMTCPSVDQSIARAASDAVAEVARTVVLYVRDGLRERQIDRAQERASGS